MGSTRYSGPPPRTEPTVPLQVEGEPLKEPHNVAQAITVALEHFGLVVQAFDKAAGVMVEEVVRDQVLPGVQQPQEPVEAVQPVEWMEINEGLGIWHIHQFRNESSSDSAPSAWDTQPLYLGVPTATPEEPIFSPTAEELSEAQRIHDRYVQAMRNELTGAVALGGELVDAASLRLAERILARGRAAGMEPPAIEDPGAAR